MTEIQLLATKMVLSNTENQIRLISFGCVSGTDSIVFVSNDSKRKYSSEKFWSCTMQFAWQHHAKQGLTPVLWGKSLRSDCPEQVN